MQFSYINVTFSGGTHGGGGSYAGSSARINSLVPYDVRQPAIPEVYEFHRKSLPGFLKWRAMKEEICFDYNICFITIK